MLRFYNNCLNLFIISFLISGRLIISSTFLGFLSSFTISSLFDLVTASPVSFPKNSLALWTTFLETVFTASSLYPIILYFLANDKNPYPLTYFVLGSIEYHWKAQREHHFYLLINNVKLTLPLSKLLVSTFKK